MGIKLFANNTSYKIGAVLFAAALWIWVGVQDNPMENIVLLVPVEYTNLESGQMIAQAENFINVRLEGRKGDLEFITSRDVTATVDLSGVEAGETFLPVQIRPPAQTQVIDVNPGNVVVVLDSVETDQWEVAPRISGNPQTGYQYLEPQLNPVEVLVEGPESVLATVATVVVEIVLDDHVTYNRTIPVRVMDADGQDITDLLRLSPDSINVLLPIYAQGRQVEKPVHVPLLGTPRPGFRVVSVEIEPRFVVVSSDILSVREVTAFRTEAVDISGVDATFSRTVSIETELLPMTVTPRDILVVVVIESE